MLTEASAAISSIKAAMEIAKAASNLKNGTEVNLAVIEIQRALLEAQSAAFDDKERLAALQSRISELERELTQVRDWEAEKARYRLMETPTGVFVYSLKAECAGSEPEHCLCVQCVNEGRKSVLQVVRRHGGGERVECHHCKTKLTLREFPPGRVDYGSWKAI